MAEGRFDEAIKILRDGAKCNGRTLPSDDELREMMQAIKDDVSSSVRPKLLNQPFLKLLSYSYASLTLLYSINV